MTMNKRKCNEMSRKLPLVLILGATGSGKTKLSLDLAKKFCGEIIGADSMQIYKKLDIISAKPTKDELKVAPHHMIDKLSPYEVCTVVDYRNEAVNIIDKLFAENKLPIVVGGTNYYIESLLWNILIDKPGDALKTLPWEYRKKNPDITSQELHEKLKTVDPEMANRLHPNNKRKIIRAIEVHEDKGRKVSEIHKEQQESEGGNSLGGGLRYRDTIIFWLQWDQETLDERIDKRVDAMIEDGLVTELLDFHNEYKNSFINTTSVPDYTTGIYQMIGLKEFHDYLMMEPSQRSSPEGKAAFDNGVEVLKRVTRRYARKQIRWIRNRFLGRSDREVPPLYALKADNVEQWEENITQPAVKIVENFIAETPCEFVPAAKIACKSLANSQDETFHCNVCERVFVGSFQWDIHMKSRKHKVGLRRAAKREAENECETLKQEKTN